MKVLGLPVQLLFSVSQLDNDDTVIRRTLNTMGNDVPDIVRLCDLLCELNKATKKLDDSYTVISNTQYSTSKIVSSLSNSMYKKDVEDYSRNYNQLIETTSKAGILTNRAAALKEIARYAPDWADAIRERRGIHGNAEVPDDILNIWKWKLLSQVLESISDVFYSDLVRKSNELSQAYRNVTAELTEKRAWYHLLKRIEENGSLQQSLVSWKQVVKRIGRGTGKQAPRSKAQARNLMTQCQSAVPAWIMSISKAIESYDPRTNKFDIVIIDEASQSDVSALAVAFLGKKIIVVGDDKQVSPMAVGIEVDKVNNLIDHYLQGYVSSVNSFGAQASMYSIAETTFHPLMLKEHFRCVPEIISFSNMLSYDWKIKPLRSANGSILLPAVVSYRVDGQREDRRKINQIEAQTITSLIKACIQQPEYNGKTFGVISLLGDEQARLIERFINKEISIKEIEERRIICGNSANFQGDERNVIFLSMVDSGREVGPLILQASDTNDRDKRYNVAVSRAKDQLWVVHSLDPANDLKGDDIRKKLIDYALNPKAFEVKKEETERKAESEFEKRVAESLCCKGYNIIQQWPVGAYRIDIVVKFDDKMVAVECDGDRFHYYTEEQVKKDMERQTILERLGWRFIRIRGSEFFRKPEETMQHVFRQLENLGIRPEEQDISVDVNNRDSELLTRIKQEAAVILMKMHESAKRDEEEKKEKGKRYKKAEKSCKTAIQLTMFD